MTYDEFWNQDSTMVRAYRELYELKIEETNFEMWLQGRYFYDALCCVAPIFRAFSKAKKAVDYPSEPFEITIGNTVEKQKSKEDANDRKARQMMEAFAIEFNKKFKEKGE